MLPGTHHHEVRKRTDKNGSRPVNNFRVRFLDKTIYVIGAFGPVFTLPQIYIIYLHKSTEGVSFLSWAFYLFSSIIWVLYGTVHKERVIIFTNSLWILVIGILLLGFAIY